MTQNIVNYNKQISKWRKSVNSTNYEENRKETL